MKKFLSVIVFITALIGTWKLVEDRPEIGFETHSSIQLKFAELIEQAILKYRPHSQNLRIEKLWTERLSESKLKATYQYTFEDPDSPPDTSTPSYTQPNVHATPPTETENTDVVEQTIAGEAILVREGMSPLSPGTELWTVQSVQIQQGVLHFNQGTTITNSPEGDLAPSGQ